MNKWIFAFLNFLSMSVVEDNGVGEEDTSAVDAVLEELSLEEDPKDEQQEEAPAEQEAEEQKEPEAVEKKPTEEPKKEEEPKEASLSEDDLKPLDSKNPKTNERFQKVTEGYKQEKQRADELAEQNNLYKQSFDSLRELGFNDSDAAQDLINFSAYRKAIQSGDADTFKTMIAEQIQQFELLHGKPVSVAVSGIDAYPDLKEKVDGLDLDQETALEIARVRKIQERANKSAQESAQQLQTQQQESALVEQAVNDVVALEANWRATDADFNAVMPLLKEHINEIKKMHPSSWKGAIELQYKTIKHALKTANANTNTPAPLRGNGHMAGKAQPASMQEAVLAEMGFE